MAKQVKKENTKPDELGEKPVSYTHLDVYKRQVLSIKTELLCIKILEFGI